MDGLLAQLPPNCVATHRERQSVRVFVPPLAQVEHFVQTMSLIKELTFMNQKAGVALSFNDCCDDLIERHNLVFEVRLKDAQSQKRAGQSARDGNLEIGYL